MSNLYQAIHWNRQKKRYDTFLVLGLALYLFSYAGITLWLFPLISIEILIMRAVGTASFILLTLTLCIGPLTRLNPKLLPLLYNRRHMGVTVFLLALIHSLFAILTYHAGGTVNPIVSILTSSPFTGDLAWIPFQPFGFFALIILFLMAATSHDFWLSNFSAPVWKSLHMLVYLAYGLLVVHVVFGILQSEQAPAYLYLTASALAMVAILHLIAGWKARKRDIPQDQILLKKDHFIVACTIDEIPENRAKIVNLTGERVAIFKYNGKIAAVSNVCQHQNGPLGEGKIIKGCITCPWHGYQYYPENGCSPPPFSEKIPTFNVKLSGHEVLIDPMPNPAGSAATPAPIN